MANSRKPTQNLNQYQTKYMYIFAFFYLVEGFVQGIPQIIFPIYLTQELGGYDIARWMQIGVITNIPWTIKFLVGLANDKWGSPRFGHRFPWIFSFGILGGIAWIILSLILPQISGDSLYTLFLWGWLLTGLGMAWADTALDGLILDVTPKEKIAKVQAWTWTMLLIGMGGGGGLLGYLFIKINAIPILLLLTGILCMISVILPKLISEPSFVPPKSVFRQTLQCFTQLKSYKVYAFTIISATIAVIIVPFYGYFILIEMGIIDVNATFLSLKNGDSIDLFEWGVLFYGFNGFGVVLGSLYNARITDRNRKKGMIFSFLIFIPFCFLSNILIGLILGLLGQILFGFASGSLDTAESTIRADLARNYYPELKSFYYAIMISCWNIGMSVGNFIGSLLFQELANQQLEFRIIYFWISMACVLLLVISALLFNWIDPKDYEFLHIEGQNLKIKTEKEEIFFT